MNTCICIMCIDCIKYKCLRIRRGLVFNIFVYRWFQYNDIALLTLDKPVKFSRQVNPICLPTSRSMYAGQTATVIGWGSLRESESFATAHYWRAQQFSHNISERESTHVCLVYLSGVFVFLQAARNRRFCKRSTCRCGRTRSASTSTGPQRREESWNISCAPAKRLETLAA